MAARGVFADLNPAADQSLSKDLGHGFVSALNNIKARSFLPRVYIPESGFGPAAQLPTAAGECLRPARNRTELDAKRLTRQRFVVEIGDRVADRPRTFPDGLL